MIKLSDFSHQGLFRFVSSYHETSLSLKININSHEDLPLVEIIQKELGKLKHLKELNLLIPKNTILSEKGYTLLSNAIINLNQLNRLSITIRESCFLSSEGLNILKDMISNLSQLVCLKLRIQKNNYISAEAIQQFLDSLASLNSLTIIKLRFQHIQRSQINDGNINFWRGLSRLRQLESLTLQFDDQNESYSDLLELFENISNYQILKSLSLVIDNKGSGMRLIDCLFPFIGKMTELRVLKIQLVNKRDMFLNQDQRQVIIKNLSNLSLLEKLKLNQLGELLFSNHFQEYVNLFGNFKQLKRLPLELSHLHIINSSQMLQLSQNFLQLTHMTNFEFRSSGSRLNFVSVDLLNNLSVSFHAMHNLQSLKLMFNENMNEKGIKILSESLLKIPQLRKFSFELYSSVDKSGFLKNISNLTNLQSLEIIISVNQLEQDILFDSMSQLSKLENLSFELPNEYDLGNQYNVIIKDLSSTLMNLRKLRSLKFILKITELIKQSELGMLEQSFQYLEDLEDLSIHLNIRSKSPDLQDISLIQHLTKLKKLDIKFQRVPLNLFGCPNSSNTNNQIESCKLVFYRKLETQEFVNIFESLSSFIIMKLDLTLTLSNYNCCQDQFMRACSKFCSIKKLTINDYCFVLKFYATGIKEMKSLKTLKLKSNGAVLQEGDAQVLDETLLNLVNLSKFDFKFSEHHIDYHNLIEILRQNSLKKIEKFKRINISIEVSRSSESGDEYQSQGTKQICFSKTLCLYEQTIASNQLNSSNSDNNDQNTFSDANNLFIQSLNSSMKLLENQIENKPNMQICPHQKFAPISIDASLDAFQSILSEQEDENQSQIITIKDIDQYDLMYLNQLKITNFLVQQIEISEQLIIGESLNIFGNLNKLISLSLSLDRLNLSEGQMIFFSDGIKYLTNLEQLNVEFYSILEHSHIFFDSLKHLTNLSELTIQSDMTEIAALSLGYSLTKIKKLQACYLSLRETICLNGLQLILQGLNMNINLRKLTLLLNLNMTGEDNEIMTHANISNLKFLEELFLCINPTKIKQLNSLKEIISSIKYLVYLNKLSITFNEAISFDQEMLDQLIGSMTCLQFLSVTTISIHLQSGNPIKMSKEFVTLFNSSPNCKLCVQINESSVKITQIQCSITLNSKTIEDLEMDFLGCLEERKEVQFNIFLNDVLSKVKTCSAKQVKLSLDYFSREETNYDIAWEFVSRLKSTFELTIITKYNSGINIETQLLKLAQNLIKLNNLKVFNLLVISYINKSLLLEMLNIIKEMQQLQHLQLLTSNQDTNKQMVPFLQRAFIRLVRTKAK